jgi:hypothetical protein
MSCSRLSFSRVIGKVDPPIEIGEDAVIKLREFQGKGLFIFAHSQLLSSFEDCPQHIADSIVVLSHQNPRHPRPPRNVSGFAMCEVAKRIVRTEQFGSAKLSFPSANFTYREDEQAKRSLLGRMGI